MEPRVAAADPPRRWLTPTQALTRTLQLPPGEQLRRPSASEREQPVVLRRRGFHVGQLGLAIRTDLAGELIDMPRLCPVPNTAPWVLGLANVRGHLVPVFDSHRLFEAERPHRGKPRVLVLGQGEDAAGLVIDDLPVSKGFAPEQRLQPPPPLPRLVEEHLRAVFKEDEQLWVEFDPGDLFEALAARAAQ